MAPEPAITTMGEKGQVVIPKRIRDELGFEPRTRFMVYADGDHVVLQRLNLPTLRKDLRQLLAKIDSRKLGLTESDVREAVEADRRQRRGR